ncbi:MAG: hypothetical protein K2I74_00245, partial [Treponemataceae bacterium]|nr:hypothetical protein [Treponemataceae bacterium]
VFSAFKSTFVAFPSRFRASKVLLSLPRRVFCVQKHFCGFHDAISAFKSTFVAFPTQFPRSKALSIRFTQKSSYSEEFLWQRL